jgi:hypothetical protein
MLTDNSPYAMLLSSLPYHGPLFGARQTPLSQIRLQQRLGLLSPEDLETVTTMRQILEWTAQGPRHNDAEVVANAKRRIPEIPSRFVRELLDWRLSFRTLVAALRRRQHGEAAPSANEAWGYGRWKRHIERHWSEPHFRLERVYDWLPEAVRQLESGDAAGFERILLGAVWRHLERLADGHHFDFEAVVIYIQRWDLIARWTQYEGAAAVQRFDTLVAAGLQGTPDLAQWTN